MRAKLKYLFDIRVQREKDILSLTALNANMEMQKYQMLLVHFFAPWSETLTERNEFASAASQMVDLSSRKLNFGKYAQVVQERDQWTRQNIYRVNSKSAVRKN